MSTENSNSIKPGRNQFELVEFSLMRHLADGSVVDGRYGINVAKVREVVRMPKINRLSSRSHEVAGIFELRGVPIPAINLAMVLGDKKAPEDSYKQIIVTEFSRKRAGFIVSSTHRIRRISWDKILPPASDAGACISGMTFIENNDFLFILDLERILLEIENKSQMTGFISSAARADKLQNLNPSFYPGYEALQEGKKFPAGSRGHLLLVDDSNLILASSQKALTQLGFHVTLASDGQAAKEFLSDPQNDPMTPPVDLIITDVEMPRMDGFSLINWIRNSSNYPDIPILLHTSLAGKANQQAAIDLGANGYVIKNDIKTLTRLLLEELGPHEAAG
ncbi:MAG: chemotaxis protein CheV [Bdellovibrionota bacterium]